MKLLFSQYKRYLSSNCLFLMLLFLNECNGDITKQSQKKVSLKSEHLNITDRITGRVHQIQVLSHYLILKNIENDTYFTLFDLNNPRKGYFKTGYMGQGPGELSNPGAVVIDDQAFKVLEGSNMRLITFHLDSIIDQTIPKYIPNTKSISLEVRPIVNLIKLNKSFYVTNEVSFEQRFGLIDSLGRDVFRFGEFPKEALETESNPFYVSNVAYQAELTSNANSSTIASATRYGEYIEFTHIDAENKKAKLINRHIGQLPIYNNDDINGVPNFALNNESIAGYLSITSDDNYVYALYSGKVIRSLNSQAYISDKIQVFNWHGDFLYEMALDKEISYIAMDKNIIYGLYETAAGYDIIKFNIGQLEK